MWYELLSFSLLFSGSVTPVVVQVRDETFRSLTDSLHVSLSDDQV